MFYTEVKSEALRFGDVIIGFVLSTPIVNLPKIDGIDSYNLEIKQGLYFVVMSPCCSISDKVVALAPLQYMKSSFWNNSYLVEDLTRINRVMPPQDALPLKVWKTLSGEEKQKRIAEGNAFAFLELFVYEGHDYFDEYELNSKEKGMFKTKYRMIDFRDIFKVNCNRINTPKDSPIELKILELSVETREELRQKITEYFSRIPNEDKPFIDD